MQWIALLCVKTIYAVDSVIQASKNWNLVCKNLLWSWTTDRNARNANGESVD